MSEQDLPPEETGKSDERKIDPWTAPQQQGAAAGNNDAKEKKTEKAAGDHKGDWEHNLINRLAFAALNEQRRSRRWNVFFKSLLFVYLFFLLVLYFPKKGPEISMGKHTAVVQVNGVISADSPANADAVIGGIKAAFEDKNTKGIILRINSPGGSPVQSGYVFDEIRRLKTLHPDVPVYAVVSELCASAAYYIAAATDQIYASRSSMVGSIGVLMDGYGFVGTMEKLGVERRLLTAGEHKGFLDPFSPMKESDRKQMEGVLKNAYQQFVTAVKTGRGDRLKDDPRVLTGFVWTGEQALDLGLVDGLGSPGYVAREVIGAEKLVDYTQQRNLLDRFAERIGGSVANNLMGAIMSPGTLR